ncbi:MAG: hypothetical protein AMXMBFR84_33060 [Candidatus Hydrogenedentota bacterium]
MSGKNPKVDGYIRNTKAWQAEVTALRAIALDCGLTEEFKWGSPCYTFQNGNVVLIHTFKAYCALLFFKGSLLKDPKSILVQQTKNVQAARQIRFSRVQDIEKMEIALKSYIREAIRVEKAGLKVELKTTSEFEMPPEFQQALDESPALKDAFDALTPGRQRAYLLHFSAPKQSKTRSARVEKCVPRIFDGMGLND